MQKQLEPQWMDAVGDDQQLLSCCCLLLEAQAAAVTYNVTHVELDFMESLLE